MLEGITILNEFITNTFNANAFVWGFLISVSIGTVICIVLALLTEDMFWMVMSIVFIIPSGLIGIFCGDCLFANKETQYQVLISEDVSMTEFNARYEIVDQEGQIFTVREKEIGENV